MVLSERQAASRGRGPFPLPRAITFPVLALGLFALFLAFPAPLDDKAHAALHGLCSQRPSHSFTLGERRLPFDARMTGIYGGFLTASAYLACRRRYRVFGLPTLPAMGLLLGGVALLGVDGVNSLLLDLGIWHPYEPHNEIRLATGLLTGIALAVAVCFLLSTTLWRRGFAGRQVVAGVGEVGVLVALQVPFALLVLSGRGWLYAPVAVALLLSATAVVSALAVVVLTILRRRDNTYDRPAQLDGVAASALLVGLAVMALIAGGRFWLEHWTGAQPLP
jgi:uncharacterized membrane protein